MSKLKSISVLAVFLIVFFPLAGILASATAEDTTTLKQLEKIILQQQAQIEAQAKAIEALQKKMDVLQAGTAASDAPVKSDEPSGLVKSAKDLETKVTLYGQVNAGVLVSNDGNETNTYLVDNDNSSTRIGVKGSVKASDGLDVGTKIEVQFESNSSSDVSQIEKRNASPNHFTKRFLELYLNSGRFGKLSLGYGSTASDGTSETDLSGTTVIGYSSVSDLAGGQYFYDNNTQHLSTTQINNVFTNMDGLGRDDRIRYDTPSFYNFSAAASYIADGGGDVALRYDADYDRYQVAAAIAYADPGSTSSKLDSQVSSSISALHKESGISLSLSGGLRDYITDSHGDGSYFYTKLGYQKDFFSIGKSAFSIDYGIYNDVAENNDTADSFGAQFVQNLKDWKTEYYLGFRHYSLDRDDADYEDIDAVLSGFRVKF